MYKSKTAYVCNSFLIGCRLNKLKLIKKIKTYKLANVKSKGSSEVGDTCEKCQANY